MPVREAAAADAEAVADIYNYYIENTWITFEEEAVSVEDMAGRILSVNKEYSWLVFEEDGEVLGFLYADRWKGRSAYRYTVETTIYLKPSAGRRGIGRRLYAEMLPLLKKQGIRMVLVCIAIPNPASIGLHESLGFKKVGIFHEVGRKFDSWIDIGYWELRLQEV